MPPASAPALRASIICFTLSATLFLTPVESIPTTQLYVVCQDAGSKICVTWPVDFATANELEKHFYRPNDRERCGFSDLNRIPPHRKFIAVQLFNSKTDRFFCNSIKLKTGAPISPLEQKIIRARRQANYGLRGRYRGQTQSQYLSIDRGNGKDEGKAEAHSAADSSRAIVSGNSGMGQAQSQTVYDPSCEDCVGRSDTELASLTRGPKPPTNGLYNPNLKNDYNRPGQNIPSTVYPGLNGDGSGSNMPGGGLNINRNNDPRLPNNQQNPLGNNYQTNQPGGTNGPNGLPQYGTQPDQRGRDGTMNNGNLPNQSGRFGKTDQPLSSNIPPENIANPGVFANNVPNGPGLINQQSPNANTHWTNGIPGGNIDITRIPTNGNVNGGHGGGPGGGTGGGVPNNVQNGNQPNNGYSPHQTGSVNGGLPPNQNALLPNSINNQPGAPNGNTLTNFPGSGGVVGGGGNPFNWPILSDILRQRGPGSTYFCCVVGPDSNIQNIYGPNGNNLYKQPPYAGLNNIPSGANGGGQASIGPNGGVGQTPTGSYGGSGQQSPGQYGGSNYIPNGQYAGTGQPPIGQYGGTGQTPTSQYGGTGQTPTGQYGGTGQTPSGQYGGTGQSPIGPYTGSGQSPSGQYGGTGQTPSGQYGGTGQTPSGQYGGTGQTPSGQYGGTGQHQVVSTEELVKHQVVSTEELVKHQVVSTEELVKHQVVSTEELVKHQVVSTEEQVKHQVVSTEELVKHQVVSMDQMPGGQYGATGQAPGGQLGGTGQATPGQYGGTGQTPTSQYGGTGQTPTGQYGGTGQIPPGHQGGTGQGGQYGNSGPNPPGQYGGTNQGPTGSYGGQTPIGQYGGTGQTPTGQYGGVTGPTGQYAGQGPTGQYGGTGATPTGQYGGPRQISNGQYGGVGVTGPYGGSGTTPIEQLGGTGQYEIPGLNPTGQYGGPGQTSTGQYGGPGQTPEQTGDKNQISTGQYGGPGQTSTGQYGGTGQPPNGPYGGTGQGPNGPYGGTGQPINGPYGSTGQTPNGPYGGTGLAPNGQYGGSGQMPNGPYGGSGQTSSGPYGGTGQTPNGPYGGSGQTPTGTGQSSTGPYAGAGNSPNAPYGATGQTPNGPYGGSGQTVDKEANGAVGNEYGGNGVPQNVVDPNSISSTFDDYDSEAEASVAQAVNGTTALASSKGGNEKGRAQTQVEGTYSGTGSFSANAEISDDNKAAQSHVSGSKKGASSSAEGRGRKNKSQASVKLGSETGSILTDSQSSGDMHSSSSQVQGSVKGGMADAQAKGPGSTSSQAQIGFTPYKDENKEQHDKLKVPFEGGGTSSAQSSRRMGTSQSQLRGTFKYGISYNGAAQAGSSLDKDAVFSNLLPFDKIDVFDDKNKNINVDITTTEKTPEIFLTKTEYYEESTTTEKTDIENEYNENIENDFSDHRHLDHHKTENQENATTLAPAVDNKRSFQTNYANNGADYEYPIDKDETPDEYEIDDGYGSDGNDNAPVEQGEYANYDDIARDAETTHQSLQSANKKAYEIKQTTGGNTQHIILGSLNNHDAKIIQRNSEHPDEARVYQPGEKVPGMGGYTIPAGFTGSVKSVASKDKTYVVGSKYSPSQAQTVKLTPGTGKIKYVYPNNYGKNVNPKELRSLYHPKTDDNRYVSVSKSVTRDLDSESNIRKQYSHTYYTKSSSCGYFTFSCTMVSSAEGKKKVCKPKIPTNPDGTPMRC
ncbi:hornerin-like [Ostrinia furnacalis]|uniref:hornerin-like n=1 Tax=Ostrinia furnacalis TaxID=93504 RepID=UPI00103EC164|nr:hornerin-like [Ostrinia furnacalis]